MPSALVSPCPKVVAVRFETHAEQRVDPPNRLGSAHHQADAFQYRSCRTPASDTVPNALMSLTRSFALFEASSLLARK